MATTGKNLSEYDFKKVPDGAPFLIGIVVSEWNPEITFNLLKGCEETLLKHGVKQENIEIMFVPGAYELPVAALYLLQKRNFNSVITLGSVIQGETKHFDFVCQAVAQGVKDVSLKTGKPVIFGVLTDDTMQQSIDRSGGKHGNKGIECAIAAIKMADNFSNIKSSGAMGFKS
jgi:6,7-dimethyl-8-ribityllumazine synthase